VLIVGPNAAGQDPEIGPERILAATGFAAHSVAGVRYAIGLAEVLRSSLALLNVVTAGGDVSAHAKDTGKKERLSRLRTLIPSDVSLTTEPLFFVEFGSAPERILEKAMAWKANLIVLGLRHIKEGSRDETTWAKAYEIVSKASCPVLTVYGPE
jgi:nucleotide-binding universal stress UspA family protein